MRFKTIDKSSFLIEKECEMTAIINTLIEVFFSKLHIWALFITMAVSELVIIWWSVNILKSNEEIFCTNAVAHNFVSYNLNY